jgi:hypothetical protein
MLVKYSITIIHFGGSAQTATVNINGLKRGNLTTCHVFNSLFLCCLACGNNSRGGPFMKKKNIN